MSLVGIVGTPLHFTATFTHVDAEDNPNTQTVDVAAILGFLPQGVQDAIRDATGQTLDEKLDQGWASARGDVITLVQQAVVAGEPRAYNIAVQVPAKGSLSAEVTPLTSNMATLLPLGVGGKQLNLVYSVPGFKVNFDASTDSIWGSWADPSYELTFDGEVLVFIAVPDHEPAPPAKPIPLGVRIEFQTENMNASADNLFALAGGILDFIGAWMAGHPPNPPPGDQTVPVDPSLLGDLSADFAKLADGLSQAAAAGFSLVEPAIITDNQGAQAVAFHLTHPFDPAPSVSNPSTVPSFFQPVIGTDVPEVNAGNSIMVSGKFFPDLQVDQITIGWNDTSTGGVVQSEVEFGQYTTPPPPSPPFPQPRPPAPRPQMLLADTTVPRTGPNDHGNTFSTPKNLPPSTWFGFRVRDFDLPIVATHWSDWTAIQTDATNQVKLVLDYASTSAVLGTATVASDGTFGISVTIPAAVPPGTYPIWAMLGNQKAAFAPIIVFAAGATLPPRVQVIDPNTGFPITGVASFQEGHALTLQGVFFAAGAVNLTIDTSGGTSLGQATADGAGNFRVTVSWPYSVLGQHLVYAEEVGGQARHDTAPVYVQMIPR